MSRVDEDRQAQRLAERLALEKRQQQDKARTQREGESAFSRLLQKATQEQGVAHRLRQDQKAQVEEGRLGQTVVDEGGVVHEDASTQEAKGDKAQAERGRAKRTGQAFTQKLKQARAGAQDQTAESRLQDQGALAQSQEGRQGDHQAVESGARSRREDARSGDRAHQERGQSALKKGGMGGAPGKGALKAEGDGGGGKGQSGGGQKDSGQQNLGAGFRFNPALMAPVPVAKPKDTQASDRLRRLANEIAQKIVERVRVGTNAQGKAEFQIDLRSNVLKGLSIKVSGGNGKIRAVFSGADKDVLALLEENAQSLKQALTGRGLTLEELKIEGRP